MVPEPEQEKMVPKHCRRIYASTYWTINKEITTSSLLIILNPHQ